MEPLSVLLIDNEVELVSTLTERLGYRGVNAEFLTNGKDAIARLREKRYDVVVLDLKMPGIGGIEVMEMTPAISVSSDEINSGEVEVDGYEEIMLTIGNTGNADLTVSHIALQQ